MGAGEDTAKGAAGGAAAGAVLGPWGAAGGAVIGGALGYWGSRKKKKGSSGPSADVQKQNRLNNVGADGQQFGEMNADRYAALSGRLNGSLDELQAQARGENSVSALQLHQGLQQNLAAQRSLAASASSQNQGMAARTAAIQSGRLGAGLAGQQAVAGLQERNQAQQNYAQMLGNARATDMQGALGGYNAATSAYGGGLNGQFTPQQQSTVQQYAPIVQGGLQAYQMYQTNQAAKTKPA